ncbi:MAG: hypothetical protein CL942_00095 [Desulfovibrio sp.]|nr:hypothetical protein [Desulfovibrio sp.]|tara:strand:+ start:1115 stop:2269 length:1155 start_codon:yes stop_codon:yes gene_type:complete
MSEVLLDSYLQAGPRLTRSGYKYTPSDDHWYIVGAGRGRHFRFYEMKGYLSSKLIDEVKVGIVASLERLAVATTQLRFRQLKRFVLASYVDGSEIDRITGLDFLNYTQTTKPDNGRKLRVFLKEMYALNLGGITSTDIELINQVDLPSPTPHLAQKTLDPVKGPYTVEEFDCLRSAIHESYENNKIGDMDYLILILINVFGLRPKQIALLKICDLIISATEAGRVEYSLNVPRVKQGAVGERYAFTCRKLGAEIGEYFSLWVEELGREISCRGIKLKYDEGLFPLFPLWNPRKREINMVSQGDYEYHSGDDRIKQIAGNCIAQAINEKSHRTGKKLIANSRRARHFIGTTMAVNGCGRRVIAHALTATLHWSQAKLMFSLGKKL